MPVNARPKMKLNNERFYGGLVPGQILHYYNGFNQFVRCVVVESQGPIGQPHGLKPVAMVGDWKASHLPSRLNDGSINLGYYPTKIAKGTIIAPHESCIYEANPNKYAVDPRTMDPIDLSVPDMTPEQEEVAAKWQKVQAVEHALAKGYLRDLDPDKILDNIRDLLA